MQLPKQPAAEAGLVWPASTGLTTPRWGNLQSGEILAKSCSRMGQGSGGSPFGEVLSYPIRCLVPQMLNLFIILPYLHLGIEAKRPSMYLIRAKHNMEQIFSQNLEIKDLSSKATFPNSSLGAGGFGTPGSTRTHLWTWGCSAFRRCSNRGEKTLMFAALKTKLLCFFALPAEHRLRPHGFAATSRLLPL